MGLTTELGSRIELVSMDPHFHDISIALYRQESETGPTLLVHTYSSIEGAQQRIETVTAAMATLGAMQQVEGAACQLRFGCGAGHQLASRRLFLEACKLPPEGTPQPRPLSIFDKKSSANVTVSSLGNGVYQLSTDGDSEAASRRCSAITGGLAKLGEMESAEDGENRIAFSCGHAHDELAGLLLVRALNVRSTLREQEMAAARGQLAAPSAQKQ
jgi:hypothetical protein